MYYVKKINGQIVGGPWPLSDDRTMTPNSRWKAEQLALHGFEIVPDPVSTISVEDLIVAKTRELAITALKAEGKLDGNGKIVKEKQL